MKKTIIYLLAATIMMSTLTACEGSEKEPGKESETKEEAATEKENPITDFEYEDNEDGGISITNYVGTSTEVVIPSEINGKDVTEIGGYAFSNNKSITYVSVPDTVLSIFIYAFENCSSLKKVRLSQNLETIYGRAFYNCTNLSEIIFPDSLTSIAPEAFTNCSSLKHINIPANITGGYEAFANSGVETIEFENGVETILTRFFVNTKIKEIILPDSVKTIELGAFDSCKELVSVKLNEGLISVDIAAFSNCTGLTEIEIPSTVTEIDETAFVYSNNLKKVKFNGNAPKVYIIEDYRNTMSQSAFPEYTICYHESAQGFTSPEWNGYKTEIW